MSGTGSSRTSEAQRLPKRKHIEDSMTLAELGGMDDSPTPTAAEQPVKKSRARKAASESQNMRMFVL